VLLLFLFFLFYFLRLNFATKNKNYVAEFEGSEIEDLCHNSSANKRCSIIQFFFFYRVRQKRNIEIFT
jgi:hypothetical protein